MTAETDAELQDWIYGVIEGRPNESGSFVLWIAQAATRADADNYRILRPALLAFAKKYPTYNARRVTDGG